MVNGNRKAIADLMVLNAKLLEFERAIMQNCHERLLTELANSHGFGIYFSIQANKDENITALATFYVNLMKCKLGELDCESSFITLGGINLYTLETTENHVRHISNLVETMVRNYLAIHDYI